MSFPGFPGPPPPPGPPPAPSPTTHNLLSLAHSDTIPATPGSGSIITSQTGVWELLPAGAENEVLSIVGGVPAWSPSAGGSASGTLILDVREITSTSGNVLNSDAVVLVSQSGAATILLLEPFDDGRQIIIKDAFLGTTDRSVNTITIVPQSGQIDGQANAQIVNSNQAFTLVRKNVQWYLI